MGDVCVIGCDDGYELMGSNTRTCLGNQTWSGTEAICVESPGECFDFFAHTYTARNQN